MGAEKRNGQNWIKERWGCTFGVHFGGALLGVSAEGAPCFVTRVARRKWF